MKKFLLLYMAPVSAQAQMQSANEETSKKMMDEWMKWFDQAGSAISDPGMPTQKVATVGAASEKTANFVGGYSIVQAEDLNKLKAMLKDHPHLMIPREASIDIFELLSMPGM